MDTGHVLGLPPSTVSIIITEAAKVKFSAESMTPGFVVGIMKRRDMIMEDMEKLLCGSRIKVNKMIMIQAVQASLYIYFRPFQPQQVSRKLHQQAEKPRQQRMKPTRYLQMTVCSVLIHVMMMYFVWLCYDEQKLPPETHPQYKTLFIRENCF